MVVAAVLSSASVLRPAMSMLSQGWAWVNEGKSPLRPKWGFVTERPGDSLVVTVRLQSLRAYFAQCNIALAAGNV